MSFSPTDEQAAALQAFGESDHLVIQAGAGTGKTGADPKQVAQKGRKLAVIAMKTRGPWSRTAAEVALARSDAVVSEYIRTGWKAADEQDERAPC
ncbi:hypothetical protein ACFYW6_23645 [Streptomyces sp. NPDC002659]|uniref:ALF repeat-containing protein n=1 Tax=Streptomyces sp. NPDC002659 TaxID=3364656 RepID=UPI00369F9037